MHVTSKSYHFFRFNYLEVCHFLVYLYICEVQVLNFTGSAIFGIPHPKFCDRHIFLLFLNKHFELSHVLLFCNGTFTMLMLNFYVQPTDITLTLLKCSETVASGEVNATKNVSISGGINKHVHIYIHTIYMYRYMYIIYLSIYL